MKIILSFLCVFLITSCASKAPFSPSTQAERDGIEKTIATRKDQYRACYEQEYSQNKKLESGKLNMAFDIQPSGKVTNVKIHSSSSLKNENVQKCMISEVQALQFTPTRYDIPTTIKYPFSFENREKQHKIPLQFSSPDCTNVISTELSYPHSKNSVTSIVRAFLSGPSKTVKPELYRAPDPKLKDLYLGHKMTNGVLTLRFKEAAREILAGSVCNHAANMAPLQIMLKDIPGVSDVQFEVGGEFFNGGEEHPEDV